MNRRSLAAAAAAAGALAAGAAVLPQVPIQAQGATGTIVGHVRLAGTAPGNPIIRMGADPRCSRATAGRRITQDIVLRSADGGLANAFVHLQGTFPGAAAPSQPVAIDQQDCLFVPRVAGARVGQALQITNSDPTAHNVHSLSSRGNTFNTSQPLKGMTYRFQLKAEDVVMRIRCDIHSWMISYVGVVPHPYFSVSGADGAFTIRGVPAGRHTIQVWHERYGRLTGAVEVRAGQTATADFSYTGKEQPDNAGVRDIVLPAGAQALTLVLSSGSAYLP